MFKQNVYKRNMFFIWKKKKNSVNCSTDQSTERFITVYIPTFFSISIKYVLQIVLLQVCQCFTVRNMDAGNTSNLLIAPLVKATK